MTAHKNRVVLPGSERSARRGSRVVGAPDPNQQIKISVRVRPRQTLQTLASANELNATPPARRKYLSREQFAASYGANPVDLAKIEAFAHEHNLTVVEASQARRTVVLSGTIAALSGAFGVYVANYEHPEGDFRGRTGPIYIPEDLTGIVQGVFGFDNRPQARPHFRQHKKQPAQPSGYTPLQVAQLYNFPAGLNGTGECIGILEFGGGYTTSDLNTYFQGLGIATPSITAVSVDGVTNQPAPGQDSPDTEVMLDIEVSGAVAPGANVVVYFSNFTEQGWVDAVTTAVHDSVHNPSVLSISWGYAEGQSIWSAGAIQAVNEAFQAAAAMGVTVCCAAGDDGSRDQVDDGLAHCDFPASSAFVLACGGTTLQSSGAGVASETVWNDGPNGGATGGGISDSIDLPTWQANAHVPPSVNPGGRIGRGVPDVAGNADPETGYQILADGQSGVVGGTSAVAPLWAGLIALINQKLGTHVGFLNPLLYSQLATASALNDITVGNNDITGQIGGYSAGPGWDACTGYGSPNGAAIGNSLGGASAAGH
ncbi:MAG TPA: S53 family peptidase [Bryobacteraceae bacterium]|nr:S53 family peptidase [Bryobacteraceae bacterium]